MKKIETRSWRFPLDLPAVIGIHATVAAIPRLLPTLLLDQVKKLPGWPKLPMGMVLGAALVVEYRETSLLLGGPALPRSPWLTDAERAMGDYTPGRYGWMIQSVFRLPEPIVARGYQRLWGWEAPPALEQWGRDQIRALMTTTGN